MTEQQSTMHEESMTNMEAKTNADIGRDFGVTR